MIHGDLSILLTTTFEEDSFPSYRCPRCGALLKPEEVSKEETAQSRIDQEANPEEAESSWVEMYFRVDLICTASTCRQVVFCIGSSYIDEHQEDSGRGYRVEYLTMLTPKMFLPHLMPFIVPPNTPLEVADSVKASFNVVFTSCDSALNEVRNALEFLMDELKVPRSVPINNKPGETASLSLHKRVERMEPTHAAYKDALLALKWLGNSGTHADDTSRRDVIHAYDILHFVLDGLFSGKAERIKALSDRINRAKGPIPRNFT